MTTLNLDPTGESAANNDETEKAEFAERMESAESYWFSVQFAKKFANEIGNSDFSSAVYDKEHDSFPNRAVGQTADMDDPDAIKAENALSPAHYFYRQIGNGSVKSELKSEFREDYEDLGFDGYADEMLAEYREKFPVPVDPNGDEMVEIDGGFVPETWMEAYDGFPPILMDESEIEPESEPEPEKADSPEENPEESENGEIPDELWDECSSDSDRVKLALDSVPELREKDTKTQIAILRNMDDVTTSENNIRKQIKNWESKDSEEIPEETPADTAEMDTERAEDNDMITISRDRLAELKTAESELEQLKEILN